MKRFTPFFLLMMLALVGALLLPMNTTQAIGEITPTPADDGAPAPTATPMPEPTAIPDTSDEDFDANALLDEAIFALQNNEVGEALEIVNQVLEVDERNATAYAIRGILYVRQDRLLLAIDDYTRAIDIIPWDWTFHTLRADTYVLLEEYGQAMMDYDRALYLNPRYEEALISRSNLHLQLGDMNAGTVDNLIAEGVSRWRFDDNVGAINVLSEAIEADGGESNASALAYYNRALAYYNLEDFVASLEDYTSAIEIDPEMHDSYLGRGIAHRSAGNLAEAGDDFLNRMELLERNSFEVSIEIGGFVDVEMAYGNVHRVTFEGSAGDSVTISARDFEGVQVDPLIALLAPDGTAIAGDDDFGGFLDSQVSNFTLSEDGTYTIVVSHANGGFDGLVRVTLE
jgi:tetratricopeptide (TPR) repeat protein